MRLRWAAVGVLALTGYQVQKQQPVQCWSLFGHADSKHKPTPQLHSLTPALPGQVTLYQYATCPFCNKVSAYLDYTGIPYRKVEVTPILKTEVKWSEYKKVPMLVVEDSNQKLVLKDSSEVISILQSYRLDRRANAASLAEIMSFYDSIRNTEDESKAHRYVIKDFPPDALLGSFKAEREWRVWADEALVHVIAPNIYRSLPEALSSFHHITARGHFSDGSVLGRIYIRCANYFGALAMYFISKMLKRKYGLETDVRQSLYRHVTVWTSELGGRAFHGGSAPDLADLAVYGTLKSIEDMDAFFDMLEHTDIGPWFYRMRKLCDNNSRRQCSE